MLANSTSKEWKAQFKFGNRSVSKVNDIAANPIKTAMIIENSFWEFRGLFLLRFLKVKYNNPPKYRIVNNPPNSIRKPNTIFQMPDWL
jgi:hypothetical protein